MSGETRRYRVVVRRRLHYPGFITRVRIADEATGHALDFNDLELAEQLAIALEAGTGGSATPRLKHYEIMRSPRARRTWLRRTDCAAASYIVGASTDAALAERAVAILNQLDPATIAPARINWHWF